MLTKDARSLSPEAQEALRKRAVDVYLAGRMPQSQVAEAFRVSRYAVIKWVQAFRTAGERGLDARPKGPAKGHGRLLTDKRAEEIRRLVMRRRSDGW